MQKVIAYLTLAALCAACGLVLSCGGSDDESTSDPFSRTFFDGIYTRTKDGAEQEVRYGTSVGGYRLTVDGEEQRRGSYTRVTTGAGKPALAFIDDGEFPGKCELDQEPGVYLWNFKDNKLTLDAESEKCDQRKDELSGDWDYQGSLPSVTP